MHVVAVIAAEWNRPSCSLEHKISDFYNVIADVIASTYKTTA